MSDMGQFLVSHGLVLVQSHTVNTVEHHSRPIGLEHIWVKLKYHIDQIWPPCLYSMRAYFGIDICRIWYRI